MSSDSLKQHLGWGRPVGTGSTIKSFVNRHPTQFYTDGQPLQLIFVMFMLADLRKGQRWAGKKKPKPGVQPVGPNRNHSQEPLPRILGGVIRLELVIVNCKGVATIPGPVKGIHGEIGHKSTC